MSRRQIAEHLRKLDEATIQILEGVQRASDDLATDMAERGEVNAEAHASLIVAASNVAVTTAVRELTGYVANGLDLVAEANRAVARAARPDLEERMRAAHLVDIGLDRIVHALGRLEQPARPPATVRIRAARRNTWRYL